MARTACRTRVQSDERKPGQIVVKPYAEPPGFLFVAVCAVRSELACVRIVCFVAATTIRRCIGCVGLRVAGGTGDFAVRANQRKRGFAVIEIVVQPGCCGVARSAVGAVSALMVIVRQVT